MNFRHCKAWARHSDSPVLRVRGDPGPLLSYTRAIKQRGSISISPFASLIVYIQTFKQSLAKFWPRANSREDDCVSPFPRGSELVLNTFFKYVLTAILLYLKRLPQQKRKLVVCRDLGPDAMALLHERHDIEVQETAIPLFMDKHHSQWYHLR